jgi:predicted metal-dependent HD superfamily phosphohydrolase
MSVSDANMSVISATSLTINTPDSDDLVWRFVDLMKRLAAANGAALSDLDSLKHSAFALVAAYRNPQRHYHSINHLQSCLDQLDKYRDAYQMAQNSLSTDVLDAKALDVIEYALYFHDAIYDPQSNENEAMSGEWADIVLLDQLGNVAQLRSCVQRLILATQHHSGAPDAQTALLLDIDLAVLSASIEEFDAYENAIRLEYAFVPVADYQRGRAQVLQRFLDAETLYHSAFFSEKTATAKANLRRALARLV